MTEGGEAPRHGPISDATGLFESGQSAEALPVTKTIVALSLVFLLLDMLGIVRPMHTHVGFAPGRLEGLWHLPFAWLCPTYGFLGFVGNLVMCGLLYGALRRVELLFGTRWTVMFVVLVGPLSLIGGAAVLRSLFGAVGVAGPEGLVLGSMAAVALREDGIVVPGGGSHVEPLRLLVWTGVFLSVVAVLGWARGGALGLVGMGLGSLLHQRDLEALYDRAAALGGQASAGIPRGMADGGAAHGLAPSLWAWFSERCSSSGLGTRWGALARSLGDTLIARAPEIPKYWDEFEPTIDVDQVRKGKR